MTESNPDPRPRLLEIARGVAAQRGWSWLEPVDIRLSSSGTAGRVWTIRTNAHEVGMNVQILIRESDGSIVQAGYLPR
jgi:hypothetical protein